MIKHLNLLLLCGFSLIANAQITVNRSHLIVSGQILTQATDTNKFKIQSVGTNKTWDFSSLKSHSTETIKFGNADWHPGHANFPKANMANISSTDDSAFNYLKIDSAELSVQGSYATVDGTIEISKFQNTILTFPSTYQTKFAGSVLIPFDQFYFGKDVDSTGPYPLIDSIRLKIEYNTVSNIDGWGKAITPLGTYDALLQTIRNINRVRVEMKTGGFWLGLPKAILSTLNLGELKPDTNYQHRFWTNSATVGFPLISYSFLPGDSLTTEVDWLKTKPQLSSIDIEPKAFTALAYPNPFHNTISIALPTNTRSKMVLYDANGKIVLEKIVTNNETIDLSYLGSGLYSYIIIDRTENTVLQVQKLIKY
jgi:hypothetical protein